MNLSLHFLAIILTTPYQFQKWEYIGAMDSIIELMLFLFSILLVKSLQMPTSRKAIVLSSFAVRLP